MKVGDLIEVTWNSNKKGGITESGVIEAIGSSWNAIYGKETTQIIFRTSCGRKETVLPHLDNVVVLGTEDDKSPRPEAIIESIEAEQGRDTAIEASDLMPQDNMCSPVEKVKQTMNQFKSAFRTQAANGGFNLGLVTLNDPDLNRVHKVVNQIDSWRLFYSCIEDEYPPGVMERMEDVRNRIVEYAEGVWADSSTELLIQHIRDELSDFDSRIRKVGELPNNHHHPNFPSFQAELISMRLRIWTLVAYLKVKLGDVISPAHLPQDIAREAERA